MTLFRHRQSVRPAKSEQPWGKNGYFWVGRSLWQGGRKTERAESNEPRGIYKLTRAVYDAWPAICFTLVILDECDINSYKLEMKLSVRPTEKTWGDMGGLGVPGLSGS